MPPRVHNIVSYSGALLVFWGVLWWRARGLGVSLGAGLATLFLVAFIVVMSGKRLDYGPFVCLFGSVLALAAGFMGTSKRR